MAKPNQEIELKLELSAEDCPAVATAGTPHGFTAGRPTTRLLRSIYFDTPDQALRRAGLSARVRKDGRNWIQTIKLGTHVSAGLSTPKEAECRVAGPALDLGLVDAPAAVEALTAALGGQALEPAFETVLRRKTREFAADDGTRIEMALDSGEIVAGDRRVPLHELELELKAGPIGALFQVARNLVGTTPFRFSPCSKAERGYRIAAGDVADPVRPATADPILLSGSETAEQALHAVLRSCLDQIAHNRVSTLLGEDPEGPHQLRVGLRRLRSALRLFRPLIGRASTASLDAASRQLAAEVGELRDLDVLADEIVAPLAANAPEGIGIAALLDHLHDTRRTVRTDLATALAGADVNALVFDLGAFAETRGWLDPGDFGQSALLATPVTEFSRQALDRQWKKVARYGRKLDELTVAERHDMRKALKKLRYGIEFFASLYPDSDLKPFLKRMKGLQDVFGYLNDVATAHKLLDLPAVSGDDPAGLARAAGFVIGWHEAKAVHAWERARDCWDEAARAPKFWR
ncbi:CYTH and CHAD domain-containing protein [Polymorphum gilvum]|uniref:Adenylate cyclase, putative n=1 Tax=Polymorphum gilvum (strain LMG 25793 / CGMCC 1.9160 / SL003B-26A1) TaxID=991905 RepID=F2J2Z5_POLGS|nr:CYTH and CHAD domain-containing protein [Polymorphum gilvum]ADZ68865.1 Adenylate cyclase, putative [Polymorphum gilvum SL003B-26A1]